MKYIFLCLLALNIAYAGYEWFGDEIKGSERDSAQRSVPTRGAQQNISLLHELTGSQKSKAMNEVVSNPLSQDAAVLGAGSELGCFGLGPFADVFDGQSSLEQIEALQIYGTLKAIDVPTGEQDFRVLIPPAASAEEAFRKLRELQASEIDSYVISQGDQAMGISLGVFSAESSALSLQGQLQEMGYSAEITTIDRLSRSYWIVAKNAEFDAFERSQWRSNRQDLTIHEIKCDELE